jgi:hypothetical protein
MGAEYLIQVAPADLRRVKRWYNSLPTDPSPFSLVISPAENKKRITSWIWVEFPALCLRRRNVVQLAYSFGGQGFNGEVALAVGAELMKRVKVRCWGWDSVGWCTKAQMLERGVPRPFGYEIYWREQLIAEEPIKAKAYAALAGPIERVQAKQKQLEEWAAKLFEDTWPKGKT